MSVDELHRELFNTEDDVYAVIDGAAVPALLAKLEEYEPEHTCLFRGELPFDLAEAAPYLVRLTEKNEFSTWLVEVASNNPCCVFAYTKQNFHALRKHFRSFLRVQHPDGKVVHFRYYDPRVLETFLSTSNKKELEYFLGDSIKSIIVYNKEKSQFINITASKFHSQ